MTVIDVDVLSRVKELLRYQILDTVRDEPFERIAALAANVFSVPAAFISFVDESRQWVKAGVGWDIVETAKKQSFCVHTIQGAEVLVIEDLSRDPRFSANPFVVGPPCARFYAGAPLIMPSGVRIGALSIVDWRPRTLDDAQCAALTALAELAVREIETHLERLRHEDAININDVTSLISNEAIISLDEGLCVRSFNPIAEEIFQRKKRDMIGRSVETLFPPRHRAAQIGDIRSVAEGLALGRAMPNWPGVYGLRADGAEFPMSATIGKVNLHDRIVTILMLRDISEIARMENKLRGALEVSHAADRSRERFLASVSHEFRTPLNAIIGFAEIMSAEMMGPLGSEKYLAYARSIAESGWRLGSMLGNVLDLSQLQDESLDVKLAPIDLPSCVRAVVENERAQLKGKGVRVTIEDKNIGSRKFVTDGAIVTKILSHLISNAIHFSHEHGLIKVETQFETEERMMVVRVTDYGLGIEASDLALLGQPFFRGGTAIQNNVPGVGLGLAISRQMAMALGGSVDVLGDLGLGSTAMLRFPTVLTG